MSLHRYTLEPLAKLALDKRRFGIKHCPCGKSNKDGKFVPFKDFEDRGYCHSCGLFYNVAKYTCPECRKEIAFSKYVDTQSVNAYLNKYVGKCLYCSYHYTPKQYFEDNKGSNRWEPPKKKHSLQKEVISETIKGEPEPPKTVSFIPVDVFKQSLKSNSDNHLITFLSTHFGAQITKQLIGKYFIGTSKHWPGATVFWQIDKGGKIRAGKIMLYNPRTGKRVKEPYNHTSWVHSVLKLPEFSLQQCFFGEHLLQNTTKPVAVCESEKTALIASVFLPQFIWITAGSKTGLNEIKCKALKGRNVVLFPDISKPQQIQKTAFELWKAKALEFTHLANFTVSELLERKATEAEKVKGLDLADYLIRFDFKQFLLPEPVKGLPVETKPIIESISNKPFEIVTTDIIAMFGQTNTGTDFGRLIIAGMKTKAGCV